MNHRRHSYRSLGLWLGLSFLGVSGCADEGSSIDEPEAMPGGELGEGCVPSGLTNPGPDVEPEFYLDARIDLHVEGSVPASSDSRAKVLVVSNGQISLPPPEDVDVYLNGCLLPRYDGDDPILQHQHEAFGSDVPIELVPGANLTLEVWGEGELLSRETQVLPSVLPKLQTPVIHDLTSDDPLVVEWESIGIDDLSSASLWLTGWSDGGGSVDTDLDDAMGIHEMSDVRDDWTHLEFSLHLTDGFGVELTHSVEIEAP